MSADNSDPAFPNPGFDNGPGNFRGRPKDGMSLRDYFAAKAMQGFCFGLRPDRDRIRESVDKCIAEQAYLMANAMLAAREYMP